MAQFLGVALMLVLPLGGFNWYVDPFHYFRDDGRYVVDPRYQRFMHAGLLRTSEPIEVLVVGTSYVANLDPDLVSAEFGGHAHILSIWGSSQRENAEATRLAIRLHPTIHTVIFEASIWNVCNTALHPRWTFPEAIYKGYPWGLVAYLLSWETADLSWRKLEGDPRLIGSDPAAVYRWWDQFKDWFGDRERLQKQLDGQPALAAPVVFPESRIELLATSSTECFRDNVLVLAEEFPLVKFLFLNPPVMQWLLWVRSRSGLVEPWLRAQERIAAAALALPNARYFDFYPAIAEVGGCQHWRDLSHFDLEVGDKIVRWLAQGTFERTPATNAALAAATRDAAIELRPCP